MISTLPPQILCQFHRALLGLCKTALSSNNICFICPLSKLAEAYFSNPNIHIVDVAYDSGFSSISSFNRSFRRIKGCSLTQFRRTRVD